MKGLKVIGLGIAIWGLGLLWPEINLLLSLKGMIGLGIGLGAVLLIWELVHHLKHWHHPNNGTSNNHPSHPVPPIALARR